jgi:Type I phosphodiesterase / nucleotide pyrophosphatase
VELAAPRVVVVIVDGLPRPLLERLLPDLHFLRERCPHRSEAVSCFPSTTGPAYFPFLAGSTPGRANVPGIRWFDRTRKTRTRFPHRGLRSYVGPDAAKMKQDTALPTIFARHAWPASSPVGKDVPKRGEKSRDLLWTAAHFFHTWDVADRRTAWKLGRGLKKGRPILFAVFPSVDEFGHFHGATHERAAQALLAIDGMLAEKLGDYEGEVVVSADHGLTDTHTHLDLRALVEERVGPTIAFPLVGKPNPEAVVCESGNAMANVYVRGPDGWPSLPQPDRCRALARELLELEGIDSVAIRGDAEHTAELLTRQQPSNRVLQGVEARPHADSAPSNSLLLGEVGWDPSRGLWQRGASFDADFDGLDPSTALARSRDERNPDAAFALVSLLASERAGDLLVSASLGHDLRTKREWPEHHASHGALHADHTLVPVLSSAPLPARRLRTLDLFGHVLSLADVPLEEYPHSDAALLARGEWTPGVAR